MYFFKKNSIDFEAPKHGTGENNSVILSPAGCMKLNVDTGKLISSLRKRNKGSLKGKRMDNFLRRQRNEFNMKDISRVTLLFREKGGAMSMAS